MEESSHHISGKLSVYSLIFPRQERKKVFEKLRRQGGKVLPQQKSSRDCNAALIERYAEAKLAALIDR